MSSEVSYAAAGIYGTINFQGKIVNKTTGTNLITGSPACVKSGASDDTCDFRLQVYDGPNPGTATLLWQETYTQYELGSNDGVFSFELGWCNGTSVDWTGCDAGAGVDFKQDNLYAVVRFNDEDDDTFDGSDDYFVKRMNAVPYAQHANIWDGVDLDAANPAIRAKASNSTIELSAQGTGELKLNFNTNTGQVQFFNTNNYVTSAGALALAGSITLASDVSISRGTNDRLDLATGDSLNLVSGNYTQVSPVTTGSGLSVSSSTLSSGNLASLTSTSTAAASNTQKVLNIATSGANATTTQTTYGLYTTNTHTGTLSTNVGAYFSASGGATGNYAAIFDAGNVGIGTTSPGAKLHVAGIITSPDSGTNSERFGLASVATGSRSAAFGNTASASGDESLALGWSATAGGTNATALGRSASAAGLSSLAIGYASNSSGNNSVALGVSSSVAHNSVALGAQASAGYQDSIAIGLLATTTTTNQLVFGSSSYPINTIFFGKGVTNATPTAFTINGTGGSGTDIAGANLVLAGGNSTGTGLGGSLVFQTAPAGSSGAGPNTLIDRMTITSAGKLGIGDTSPDHTLDVAGNIGLNASSYINYGDTDGTSGYGFFDNSGNLQYKNSGGAWTNIGVASSILWNLIGSPSANQSLTMGAYTSTWTWDSLTTGTGLTASSSSLSSGNLASLAVTGTAAAGSSQTVLNLSTSGANSSSTQSTYGLISTNTHTGTSSTNIAGYFSATNGTTNAGGYFTASGGTNNYAAIFDAGNVGIGTQTPGDKLDVVGEIDTSTYYKLGNTKILNHANTNSLLLGYSAGANLPSGADYNTFLGDSAGGNTNNAVADNNTLIGYRAGDYNASGQYNTFLGSSAGMGQSAYTSSSYNVSIGGLSLYNITSNASSNTAIGYQAGYSNTSGSLNFYGSSSSGFYNQTGSYNVFLGESAGSGTANYTASNNNVAIGQKALYSIGSSTDNNIALGNQAGYSNTTGINNYYSGYQAGYYNQTGTYNIFQGYQAGSGTAAYTGSDNNIALGQSALYSIGSSTDYNIALGYQAGYSNTTGINNYYSGYQAGYYNQTGTMNIFQGNSAGMGTAAYTGSDNNIALGQNSLYSIGSSTDYNIALGYQAGYSNTTGTYNLYAGMQAGYSSTTGVSNIMLGSNSGYNKQAGSGNVFLGPSAGYGAALYSSSNYNVAIGQQSLFSIGSSTDYNIALGYQAGYSNTTGTNNYYSGYQAGYYNQTGTYNIFQGYQAGSGTANYTGSDNNIALGQSALYSIGSSTDYNIALGYQAGYYNQTGTNNIFQGYQAGRGTANYTGSDNNIALGNGSLYSISSNADSNIALGIGAGTSIGTASYNFFVGEQAGTNMMTGNDNIFLGYRAGVGLPGSFSGADNNIALGNQSLGNIGSNSDNNIALGLTAGYSNTTGNGNSYIGTESGYYNQTGTNNIFQGYQAGRGTAAYTSSSNNIALGNGSLYSIGTNSSFNIALGFHAGYYNQTGTDNIFIGDTAGSGAGTYTGSDYNTALGVLALGSIGSNSDNNVAIGTMAGYSTTTSGGNVFLGYSAGYSETTGNKLYIENSNSSTPLIWGDFANDYVNINGSLGVGDASPDHKLDVAGNIGLNASSYINYGDTDGTSGYGFYDNSGTLQYKNSGGAWTNISAASTVPWSGLQNPSGNLSLSMGSYTTTFTAGNATSTNNIFTFADTASNTGTGYLMNIATASGSTLKPFHISAAGVEALTVLANSYVGIGTTSPSYKLDVNASVNDYLSRIYNTNTGSSAGGLYIRSDGTGNLLTLNNSGNDIFSVSPTQATFNVPSSFTASGDVSLAYDLYFTNQSASYIKTLAPFTIEVGENFESNNLTLKTYNSGSLVLDLAGGIVSQQAQAWDLANSSTTALNIESGLLNLDTTNGRVGIGTTAPTTKLQVAGHISPSVDDTYDLGTSSLRFRDLYLGPASLHIGTSSSDEGVITYDTTNNILNFGSDVTGNADIAFFTDDLYLDKDTGYVGIGTTSIGYPLDVYVGSGDVANFANGDGACVMNPTKNGVECSSDARLKKNIETMNPVSTLSKVLALRPVTFEWNNQTTNEKRLGLIAQEAEIIFPEIVSTNKNGFKSIAYGSLTPLIISSIQEQQQQIAVISQTLTDISVNDNTLGYMVLGIQSVNTKVTDLSTSLDATNAVINNTNNSNNLIDFSNMRNDLTLDAMTTIDLDTNSADLNIDSGTLYIDNAGFVGINTLAPKRKFEVLDSTDPQIRISQLDNVNYADVRVDDLGNLSIFVTGTNVYFGNANVNTNGNIIANGYLKLSGGKIYDANMNVIVSFNSQGKIDKFADFTGEARRPRTINLDPEYSGSVQTSFYGSGTDILTTGNLTTDVDADALKLRTYYKWSTSELTTNYKTIAVKIALPTDFDAWQDDAITIEYKTKVDDSSENNLNVYVFNSTSLPNTPVSSVTDKSSVNWAVINIEKSTLVDSSAPDWNGPADTGVIYLRMATDSTGSVEIGEIKLNYLSKW